jgi:hypothetical protein
MGPLSRVRKSKRQVDAGRGKTFCKLIADSFCHAGPLGRPDRKFTALGTSTSRTVSSRRQRQRGSIEAEVEPIGQHREEYADHKCYYVDTTTPILPRQGAEQPTLRGARQQPTIDVIEAERENSIATHSWLKAAFPESVKPARSLPSKPRPLDPYLIEVLNLLVRAIRRYLV